MSKRKDWGRECPVCERKRGESSYSRGLAACDDCVERQEEQDERDARDAMSVEDRLRDLEARVKELERK